LQRGSPFAVSTRIQYVRVIEFLSKNSNERLEHPRLTYSGLPSTVFLLGTRDEFMSPADCTELGPRAEFAYIELPGSNHAQVLNISGNGAEVKIRRNRLISALKQTFKALNENEWAIPPEDIDDYLNPMDLVREELPNNDSSKPVEHVVMVIHGIRDDGFWTKRVAREIKSLSRERNINIRVPTPSYGFFSMWDFIRLRGREDATRWFMEHYADIQSRFPNAKISFVGHSNGTYIVGRALSCCPSIKFHRIVLTGSVLRCSFNWEKVGKQNFANKHLRSRLPFNLEEVEYIKGGHGAAIGEGYWSEIANFIVTGEKPSSEEVKRMGWRKGLYLIAPLLTVAAGIILLGLLASPLLVVIWISMNHDGSPPNTLLNLGAVIIGIGVSWGARRFLKAW